MLDRSSSCPVQVSSCVSAEKLEISGGSSAELAACYAFAALAPTRTFSHPVVSHLSAVGHASTKHRASVPRANASHKMLLFPS